MATTLAEGCPRAVPLACVVAVPLLVLALFVGCLARPNERRFDCGSQLTPLVAGLGGVCAGAGFARRVDLPMVVLHWVRSLL
jgi:hypothetical protein